MKIETTINIKRQLLHRLTIAKSMSGKTMSRLIEEAMKKSMNNFTKISMNNRRVQYQQKAEKNKWHCLHISIYAREYEFFLDMRKFYKRSVSYLASISLEKYLDEIIDDRINNGADNYLFTSYILTGYSLNNVICWKIYWGLPEDHEHIFK